MMAFKLQKNVLHYYINLLRQKTWEETNGSLYNIIRTMRMARNNKVCDEDFSYLDFGKIPLNGVLWSISGKYQCDFQCCHISNSNFISGHSDMVSKVAFSDDASVAVSYGYDNYVIIWDVSNGLQMERIYFSGLSNIKEINIDNNLKEIYLYSDKSRYTYDYMNGKIYEHQLCESYNEIFFYSPSKKHQSEMEKIRHVGKLHCFSDGQNAFCICRCSRTIRTRTEPSCRIAISPHSESHFDGKEIQLCSSPLIAHGKCSVKKSLPEMESNRLLSDITFTIWSKS